jgi:hypothetical protein
MLELASHNEARVLFEKANQSDVVSLAVERRIFEAWKYIHGV